MRCPYCGVKWGAIEVWPVRCWCGYVQYDDTGKGELRAGGRGCGPLCFGDWAAFAIERTGLFLLAKRRGWISPGSGGKCASCFVRQRKLNQLGAWMWRNLRLW